MAHLIDTNVLVRLANSADAQHAAASRAVLELHRQGEILHLTPQVLIEFRGVATRPVAVNGLGLSVVDAESLATGYESRFRLLAETPNIYPAWKAIVAAAAVAGKQVHDARIVAVCHAYGVTHLLTFNASHFMRFTTLGPGLTLVDPATV